MYGLADLEKRSPFFWVSTGFIFVILIASADAVTEGEFALSFFYMIPIFLVTWFAGRNLGIVISLVSAVAWLIADIAAGHAYSEAIIGYWNAAVRLGFFIVVPLLLPALKALEREKEIARIDHLTGAANRLQFFESAKAELYRSQRYKHPFTLAYIDLDGLKTVNDRSGHAAGDQLLCAVVRRAKSQLRRSDILARLGGDEFVLLLPEIGEGAARLTVPKIQTTLLEEVRRNDWPVTFSIGVLTYQSGEVTADELIKRADDLMYSVKNNGKNGIAYAVYTG